MRTEAVCFDIGGVLVRIAHTWQDALRAAGLDSPALREPQMLLSDLPAFDPYQAGKLSYSDYLKGLADALEISTEQAALVHESILIEPYPGVERLVREVKAAGLRTACCSNTNEPHWIRFTTHPAFSAIQHLDVQVGSHQVGLLKPNRSFYELMTKLIERTTGSILFFDDSQLNVEGAVAAGWQAHRIDPENDPPAQMQALLAAALGSA